MSFYIFQRPNKSLMICSPDNKLCLDLVTYDGGATTSVYNNIFLYDDNALFKKILFSVDKAFPSQIKLKWNSPKEILVVVPSCSLVERVKNMDNLNTSFQEDNGINLVDCKF